MKWLESIQRKYRVLILLILFLSFVIIISVSENIILSMVLLSFLIIYAIPFCYIENKLSKEKEVNNEENIQQKNKLVVWFEGLSSKVRLGICFVLIAIFLLYIIVLEVDVVALFLAVIAGFYLFYAIYVEEKLARRKEFEKKLEEQRLKEEAKRNKKELASNLSVNVSISSSGAYSRSLEFPIYTKARGVTFEGRQALLEESSAADDLIIVHRPTKKYPERMVIINESIDEEIGNVSAELAKALVEEYGEGCKFYGMIAEITGGKDGNNLGCNFSIDGLEFD